jgi:hypothetical protein
VKKKLTREQVARLQPMLERRRQLVQRSMALDRERGLMRELIGSVDQGIGAVLGVYFGTDHPLDLVGENGELYVDGLPGEEDVT